MSATVSLKGLYQFSGWIIDNIDLNFKQNTGDVFLRKDGRKKVDNCPYCDHPMGAMRVVMRRALDLPVGTLNQMTIHFTASQGKCSKCGHFHTFLPEGIEENNLALRSIRNKQPYNFEHSLKIIHDILELIFHEPINVNNEY